MTSLDVRRDVKQDVNQVRFEAKHHRGCTQYPRRTARYAGDGTKAAPEAPVGLIGPEQTMNFTSAKTFPRVEELF